MKEEKIFIIDYACGFHPFVCEVDYTCALRCQAALRAFKKYPQAKFVLGAGMENVTQGCGSLAGMMRDFLVEHGVSSQVILSNPHGHNTLTETEAVYEIIQKQGGGKVVCATSRYHVPRVWCIWFFRFGIIPEIYSSKLGLKGKPLVREYLKVPFDCVRALINRFYGVVK